MSTRLLTATLGCWALVLLAGCSSFSVSSLWGPKIKFADAEHPAAEIICMWEPSEGKTSDGKPTRGFNGTILFFDRTHSAPIGVNGKLIFYVYDDIGPRETWSEPIKEYSFTAEEWNQFFTMGSMGPTYRIFIPYPRKHPFQVNTSLWVKFEPSDGNPAFYSRRSPIVLPGPLMEDDRVKMLEMTDTRNRSIEQMQDIVAKSFSESDRSSVRDPRVETIHRWNTGKQKSTIELTSHEVTRGLPTGANVGRAESAPGADAESWGSTPPALLSTLYSEESESDEPAEPPAPRKRFKLTAPQ